MDLAEATLSEVLRSAGLAVQVRTRRDGTTGPEALWVVDAPPEGLKRLAVGVEEAHAWGRLLDADVMVLGASGDPEPVSRRELGFPSRPCLICGDAVGTCMGFRRHPRAALEAVAAGLLLRITGRP